MQKCDLLRLTSICNSAERIATIGQRPVQLTAYANKLVESIDACDTLIINCTDVATILKVLEQLNYDCTVMVLDCSSTNLLSSIRQFLDLKSNNFQYSRQMLVDGMREKSLLIKYSKKKTFRDRSDAITVFLVLRTGGPVYDSRYVNATASNIRANLTHAHEIVCITDNSSGITEVDRIVKMRHNWPKWWGKVELFREDVTKNDHCMFMDLDTVCIGNIDYLCSATDGFYGLRDFYNIQTFQTGVLKWDVSESTANIYNRFTTTDIAKYINKGDHEWIGENAENKRFLQDTFPGELSSYKKHLPHIQKKFMSPSVVCFHGDPRPHAVRDKFITDVWKYR